eukprot:12916781-Prorocentrum_lima.AAC.1
MQLSFLESPSSEKGPLDHQSMMTTTPSRSTPVVFTRISLRPWSWRRPTLGKCGCKFASGTT